MLTIHATEERQKQKKDKRSNCRGCTLWSVATNLRESRYPTEIRNASETRFPKRVKQRQAIKVQEKQPRDSSASSPPRGRLKVADKHTRRISQESDRSQTLHGSVAFSRRAISG